MPSLVNWPVPPVRSRCWSHWRRVRAARARGIGGARFRGNQDRAAGPSARRRGSRTRIRGQGLFHRADCRARTHQRAGATQRDRRRCGRSSGRFGAGGSSAVGPSRSSAVPATSSSCLIVLPRTDDHIHYPVEVLNRAAGIFRMAGHMFGKRHCREQPGRRSRPCGLRVALASGSQGTRALCPGHCRYGRRAPSAMVRIVLPRATMIWLRVPSGPSLGLGQN
jgi:hypothetical protein